MIPAKEVRGAPTPLSMLVLRRMTHSGGGAPAVYRHVAQVIRNLRRRGEPIRLFGETDEERILRLRALEAAQPEIDVRAAPRAHGEGGRLWP